MHTSGVACFRRHVPVVYSRTSEGRRKHGTPECTSSLFARRCAGIRLPLPLADAALAAEVFQFIGQVLGDVSAPQKEQGEAGVGHAWEAVAPTAVVLLIVEDDLGPPGVPVARPEGALV